MSERVLGHIVVHGRVQGVYFRAFVERAALKAGVEGWVRNRCDGSVEAVFAGPFDAVDALTADCRRGPSAARVDALDQREATADELKLRRSDERFSVLPAA